MQGRRGDPGKLVILEFAIGTKYSVKGILFASRCASILSGVAVRKILTAFSWPTIQSKERSVCLLKLESLMK